MTFIELIQNNAPLLFVIFFISYGVYEAVSYFKKKIAESKKNKEQWNKKKKKSLTLEQ